MAGCPGLVLLMLPCFGQVGTRRAEALAMEVHRERSLASGSEPQILEIHNLILGPWNRARV